MIRSVLSHTITRIVLNKAHHITIALEFTDALLVVRLTQTESAFRVSELCLLGALLALLFAGAASTAVRYVVPRPSALAFRLAIRWHHLFLPAIFAHCAAVSLVLKPSLVTVFAAVVSLAEVGLSVSRTHGQPVK